MLMAEKDKSKRMQVLVEPKPKGFNKYVRDHKRRLEELEGEATGSNMERPRSTDYSEYLEDS